MQKLVTGAVLCVVWMGCSGGDDPEFSAEDELMLAAISGEEEDFMRVPGNLTPDSAVFGQPALFRTCGAGQAHADLFAQYDTDGDGQLSEDERAALWTDRSPIERVHLVRRAFRWSRIEWIYDADESGELDATEREALTADFTERCGVLHDRLVVTFDIDEDGILSPPERVVMRADRLEARLERRAALLDTYDTDDSGRIEPDEVEAIREGLHDAAHAFRAAMLDRFDLDGTGQLEADERETKRTQQREWIRAGLNLQGS